MAERPTSVDPAVAALIKESNHRERMRQMSPGDRKKARRDEDRSKATYDLPPEIIEAVNTIAKKKECSVSSLAALLLAHGLQFLALGGINFDDKDKPLKRASRSIRFKYTLEIDDDIMEKVRRYITTLAQTPA
jgi:hypothetical protein